MHNQRNLDPAKHGACEICAEMQTGRMPQRLTSTYGTPSRVIARSSNFIAVPSISPLCAGHVLIFPYEHSRSMREVPSHHDELLQLVETVGNLIEKLFGPPLLFEHGVAPDAVGGCGIDHAHLHIAPVPQEHDLRIFSSLRAAYRLHGPAELRMALAQPPETYIMIGRFRGPTWFTDASTIPSQLLRKLISTELGGSTWDWRAFSNVDEFQATLTACTNQTRPRVPQTAYHQTHTSTGHP